jgi:hypothetical protein
MLDALLLLFNEDDLLAVRPQRELATQVTLVSHFRMAIFDSSITLFAHLCLPRSGFRERHVKSGDSVADFFKTGLIPKM